MAGAKVIAVNWGAALCSCRELQCIKKRLAVGATSRLWRDGRRPEVTTKERGDPKRLVTTATRSHVRAAGSKGVNGPRACSVTMMVLSSCCRGERGWGLGADKKERERVKREKQTSTCRHGPDLGAGYLWRRKRERWTEHQGSDLGTCEGPAHMKDYLQNEFIWMFFLLTWMSSKYGLKI